MRKKSLLICFATIMTVAISAPSASRAGDIVDTAVAADSFSTLVAAVQNAGLVDTLKGDGPFTVFAPTDEAFAKLPEGTVENLLKPENRDQLIAILTYHVVPGRVLASNVVKLTGATTVNGQRVDISTDEGVQVDNAKVVETDIECSNGVIHVIDSVLLPATDDIPTVAINAGSFNTLVAAARQAGLVSALAGEGPLTVFAPTDEAFAKLPAGTVETLLKPENRDKLTAILTYHVVKGRVYSDAALEAGTAQTLQGGSVSISADSHGARSEQREPDQHRYRRFQRRHSCHRQRSATSRETSGCQSSPHDRACDPEGGTSVQRRAPPAVC